MMNNIEVRRDALLAYIRFSEGIYAANAADCAAVRKLISAPEIFGNSAETMCSLEGDLAVWATENASIRANIMNDFAELAMAVAQDREIEELPREIHNVLEADDDELRQYIAERTEKIKYTRKMRGNKE